MEKKNPHITGKACENTSIPKLWVFYGHGGLVLYLHGMSETKIHIDPKTIDN